jgi:phage gp36-like protein
VAEASYGSKDDLYDLGYMPATDVDKIHTARPTRIPRLFAAVSSWANTYLRAHYSLPLVEVPDGLVDHVCAIVVYRLYVMRGFRPTDDKVVKAIEEAYALALQWFKDLADPERKALLADNIDQTPERDETEPAYGAGYDPKNPYNYDGGGGSGSGGCCP